MHNRIFFALFLLAFALLPAFAHDGWIEKRDGQPAFFYGHAGKLDPYKPEYIREAKAFDAAGRPIDLEIIKHKDYASLAPKSDPSFVTMLYDSGYWVKTTDGYKNIGKREAQEKYSVIEARRSRKDAKAVFAPCEIVSKPVGLFLEIIPEKDPLSVKPGDNLPVRVLLEGKPVEGLQVALGTTDHSESKDLPKTDKDGKVQIAIIKNGLQLVTTTHSYPISGDPDADIMVACSSLSFTIK